MHILHETIGVPRFKIAADGRTKANLTVNPLPSGYGMTLGNALRRVMLSSLPGAAVTAVKIDSVSHEYQSIPGVKESALDCILNLRQLKLRKHSKGDAVVEVPFVKSGTITAKDLKVPSDVEILDPSQIIAHCTDADPKKKMHLRISKGVGFRIISNEDHTKETDTGFILMDANFSPVTKVSYEVVPTRVGDQTNLDELQLSVETNGSLDAEKCIKLSANIMQSYFEVFNKEEAYVDEEFTTSFSAMKEKEEAERMAASVSSEQPFTPIDILGFSQRTLNALVNGGITSVEQLLDAPMSQLSQLRGFGQKAKTELEQVLTERGYRFVPETGKYTHVEE